MNDLIVVTGASCVSGTLNLYSRQLLGAGIDFHVEDTSFPLSPYFNRRGNLRLKLDWIRLTSLQFRHYRAIVFSDGFDVTFYGTKEDVLSKIPTEGILWAGEKNCYPDPSLSAHIPKRTPWCFANGGLVAGSPEAFLYWASEVEKSPLYNPEMLDQHFHNMMLVAGLPLCIIDDRTELFYCLFGGYDELDFEKGIPVNRLFGTHPNFIHANGKWPAAEAFAKLERSLQ